MKTQHKKRRFELVCAGKSSCGYDYIMVSPVEARDEAEALNIFAKDAPKGHDGTKTWFFDNFAAQEL